MRCPAACTVLSAGLMLFVGCGESGTSSPAAASNSGGASATTAVASTNSSNPTAAPIAAARTFLQAVQKGQTERAAGMLTPLALQMTTENDLSFSPPGSATAQFTIVDAQMVDADKAVVETIWSDLDADGNRTEEQIAWALRLDAAGWRISGMAAEVAADQPPLVIDFENPRDLIEQDGPQTTGQSPAAMPQPKNPADQVARDPFQDQTTR